MGKGTYDESRNRLELTFCRPHVISLEALTEMYVFTSHCSDEREPRVY